MPESELIKKYLEEVRCNYCKNNNTRSIYKVRESYLSKYPMSGLTDYRFSIVKCNRCGLIYVNPRVKYQMLREIYEKWLVTEDDIREKDIDSWENLFMIRLFSSLECICSKGILLDIGCGWGHLLGYASSLGWDVIGCEIDELKYRHCIDQGINVVKKSIAELDYKEESFDLITAVQVMEHVSEPMEIISIVWKLLKPGGIFIIDVPNFYSLSSIRRKERWHIIHPVEHLFYYTYPILKKMLTQNSFKVIKKKRPVNHFGKKNIFLEFFFLFLENTCGLYIDNITIFSRKSP